MVSVKWVFICSGVTTPLSAPGTLICLANSFIVLELKFFLPSLLFFLSGLLVTPETFVGLLPPFPPELLGLEEVFYRFNFKILGKIHCSY
jgi:hypothetical protein